jgi:hypothetical protein
MMEQLVVILIFAICAAVCVSIFVESYLTEHRTLEMKNAILIAGSGAESYKASGGSVTQEEIFYDDKWDPCDESRASYVLRIKRLDDPDLLLLPAEITVSRTDGEELFVLPVAVIAAGAGGTQNEK